MIGLFFLVLSSNLVERVPRCKQKQRSGWDFTWYLYMSAFLVQLCSPMLHNSSVSTLKILHFCFHNPNLRNREWSNRYLQDQKFATSCDITEWITTMLQPNTEIKRAASPIIHSARKCSSRFIWSAYVLSNLFSSKPSIVFSPQKPFYSQSNYSFWWLGIFF